MLLHLCRTMVTDTQTPSYPGSIADRDGHAAAIPFNASMARLVTSGMRSPPPTRIPQPAVVQAARTITLTTDITLSATLPAP